MLLSSDLLWRNLRSPQISELADRDAIVILPIGAIEQHGPHLPVETDSRLAEEVSVRAARLLSDSAAVVVAPTIWCGLSEHHMAYAGTLSVRFETFASILADVCSAIQRHGFRDIVIVNGHGGNIAALKIAVGTLSRQLEHPVMALTYCHLPACASAYGHILEDQENVRHAGEAETSMMLAISPDLVDREAMIRAPNACFSFSTETGVYRFARFDELSTTGVNGITKNASEDKGEALLATGAKAVAESILAELGRPQKNEP